MTIDRDGWDGPIVIHCDGKRCAEVCETRCSDFPSALAKAKSRGWRVTKRGDDFIHLCPDEAA